MASTSFLPLTAFFLFSLAAFAAKSRPLRPSPFRAIYQFGDSLSDTGNLLRWGPMFFPADKLPYGETYFGEATGRFSDGRLILDHIATALGLPFIEPYLDTNASFAHGVNFAVAGATANDEDFFTQRGVNISTFKPPIIDQLKWFEAHLNSTCRRTRGTCSKRFKDTLFIFGEYGGNDYFPAFQQGKSIEEVKTFVPHTVDTIVSGIRHIVGLGAKRVIVPGPFPFGCLPSILGPFATADEDAYDDFGCLKPYNDVISYHNARLRTKLASLNREFPGVVIVYADYYGAVIDILRNAERYGFDERSLLKACCGTGGKYNYDEAIPCGTEGAEACENPGTALHWDGVHLTDAAYYRIAHIVIDQVFDQLINVGVGGLLFSDE